LLAPELRKLLLQVGVGKRKKRNCKERRIRRTRVADCKVATGMPFGIGTIESSESNA
jgi:hypothetical protein